MLTAANIRLPLLSLLAICILSCSKDEKAEPSLYGEWQMKSNFLNGYEEWFGKWKWYKSGTETSCGYNVTYYYYQKTVQATVILESDKFTYSATIEHLNINSDSTYISCNPQYLSPDTTSYTAFEKTTILNNGSGFTLSFQYGTSPGGTPLYTSQTFHVVELTDHELKLSGPGPNILTLANWGTSVYTFTR